MQNTRRNFLKYSTLAGMGIAVNPFATASTANSPVTPNQERNAIIIDAPSTMLTQVHGVDYQFV